MKKDSFAKKFFLYLGLGFGTLLIFFSIFTAILLSNGMDEMAEKEVQAARKLHSVEYRHKFLEIVRYLEIQVKSPLVVNTLMQFDQNSLALSDFLSSLAAFDSDGKYSVVSFDGSYLYGSEVYSEKEFDEILNGKSNYSIKILDEKEESFSFMIPIRYRNFVEGVLIYNAKIDLKIKQMLSRKDLSLSLYDGRKELRMGHQLSEVEASFKTGLGGGLDLLFYHDRSIFLASKYSKLVVAVGLLLLFGGLVGWVFYRKAKRHFLNPHQKLIEMKEELNQSASLKDSILNSSELMIISTNEEGVVSVFNKAAEIKLGFDKEEVIGRLDFVDLINEEVLAARQKNIQSAHHKTLTDPFEILVFESKMYKKAMDSEMRMIKSDNIDFPVRVVSSPIVADGDIQGFVFVLEDITKVKLVQRAERQALKELERVANLKSEFLANMSHEIRTPMNGVLGMVNLLADTKLNENQRDLLETIRSSGDGLMTVLNDVLDFSKIDSGKMKLEYVDFQVEKCVQEALFLVQVKADEKSLELSYEIDDFTPDYLYGDITRLRQVLVNFLTNAVKFTDKGSVKLIIETNVVNEKENLVQFKVRDTGIGISKENQKKLFNAFSQADTSITRKYGGTGLGLAISSKLIEAMNGKISLKSTPGVGSLFTAKIPLKTGKSLVKDKENTKSSKGKTLSGDYSHKILVAEDNSINQKLAKLMLEKIGYSCDVVGNGYECLQALKEIGEKAEAPYTIVFMDMQMPEMDGLEATRRIVSSMADSRPKIVAMTANAFKEDREKCFEAGMDDFVAKPIKQEELERVLMKYGVKCSSGEQESEVQKLEFKKENIDMSLNNEEEEMADIVLFDREELLKSFSGDEDILNELVEDFAEAWPGYIAEMRTSLEKGDLKSLEISAHTIKGLTATFKAMELKQRSYEIEQQVASGNIQGLNEKIDALESSLTELISQLQAA